MTIASHNPDHIERLYRLLPSVNELLLKSEFLTLLRSNSQKAAVQSIRGVLLQLRQEIAAGQHTANSLTSRIDSMHSVVQERLDRSHAYSLRRVINATGVVLHTNLGRAPLSASAIEHLTEVARGYSNLELDLETGERSRRDIHVEQLLLRLLREKCGGHSDEEAVPPTAAVVVNNCAAATFLALNSIAEGTEVIVSRGELVEIGGGFRIPEILVKSGARMREVGTTNRTRISDYESAITPDTGLILRVHQSNFSIEGFTERPSLDEVVSLGKRSGIPVLHDQGTGLILDLDEMGVRDEPTLLDSFRLGPSLIAASGDKLLGGPQCGLLIGRRDLVERIRKNPLLRACRVDKLTYAALEAALMDYIAGRPIPTVGMLRASPAEILRRCEVIAREVNSEILSAEAVPVLSLIGGGTAPSARLQSSAVALRYTRLRPQSLMLALRRFDPPIIGRIENECVLLDLRTVEPEFDTEMLKLLRGLASALDKMTAASVGHAFDQALDQD